MLRFPNCKINLGLYITGRREDGYHNLETIFYPLPLRDVLEIVPAEEGAGRLQVSGLAVSGEQSNNLVFKAYKLLQAKFPGQIPELDIYLHKVIPMGAGLGGGSADGACMLELINDFAHLELKPEYLAELALELGSDCPFFIYNSPQFASGRGEILEPVTLDLPDFSLQLICPDLHVSTAGAFQMIRPRPAPFDLRKLPSLPLPEWRNQVSNDFEGPVFEKHPELRDIRDQLYAQGALFAAMSGSGSAIFGIFPKGKSALVRSPLPFTAHNLG